MSVIETKTNGHVSNWNEKLMVILVIETKANGHISNCNKFINLCACFFTMYAWLYAWCMVIYIVILVVIIVEL